MNSNKPAPAPMPEVQKNECEAYIIRRIGFRQGLSAPHRGMLELEIERAWVTSRLAAVSRIEALTRRLAEVEERLRMQVIANKAGLQAQGECVSEYRKAHLAAQESNARAEAAEAKLKRMGLKLERLGKHLHETRAKLRKVEQEREKYRERCKTPVTDPCIGCVNLRPDGNHEWACCECKRWWSDKFAKREKGKPK